MKQAIIKGSVIAFIGFLISFLFGVINSINPEVHYIGALITYLIGVVSTFGFLILKKLK